MFETVLMVALYGGYISIVKIVIFLLFFFASWALVQWVYKDATVLEANSVMWTGILLGGMTLLMLLWFILPVYLVGALAYVVAVGGIGMAYVKHRNARVLDFDKILTVDHFKRLMARDAADDAASDAFVFVTTNKNEVPRPEPRTQDFFGYRATYDILSNAITRRAESITFIPGSESYKVSFQIDGAALPQPDQTKDQIDYFVRFVKQLADLDINERRKPQKGIFFTRRGKVTLDWQIKTAGSTAGEQIQILKASKAEVIRTNELGLTKSQLDIVESLKATKSGIFLISGPPGSGVTSTFYSILRGHDAFVNSIYTFEKEITSSLPSVTQQLYTLSDTASTTYARKLQQVFRMGPDIVGVAECIDPETARTICEAARDGKLVLVILQAESVLKALGRWLKLVGDRKSAVRNLIGISNQRLLRKLCDECKQGYAPNKEILKKFNLPEDKAKVLYRPGKVIYDKRGKESMCETCFGTGFVGRTGVYEMIALNDELKSIILKSKTLQEMGTQFRRAKMISLQEQALRKVMAGVTAINEMVRVLTPAARKKSAG